MERIVHKSLDFKTADTWDRAQHLAMTPQERMSIAKTLKTRVYPPNAKDVRAWHQHK